MGIIKQEKFSKGDVKMKKVYGSYMQAEEAIKAVEELKSQGYTRNQIRVVSTKDCGSDCNRDLEIEKPKKEGKKDDRSLWEKFRDVYTYSDYKQDYWNTYVEEDEVLRTYKRNLESGEILVLIDSDQE